MLGGARRLEEGVWRSATSEDVTSGGGINAMIATGRQVQVSCRPVCLLRSRFNLCRCVQLKVKKGYAGARVDYTTIALKDCHVREIYQVTAGNRREFRWPQLASRPGGPLESGAGVPLENGRDPGAERAHSLRKKKVST